MPVRTRAMAISMLASAAAMLALAGTASAQMIPVSGKQVVVNESAGTYKMNGGLLGSWKITSFKEIGKGGPVFHTKGTEQFKGCVDLHYDRGCAGDPSGTLSFKFLYWGEFDPDESLVWGSCRHPITSGTGDFTGAHGVLVMVDTPTPSGSNTTYMGSITLGTPTSPSMASAPRTDDSCGGAGP